MDRVQRRPAVVAGMEISFARANLEVERDQTARGEDELRPVPPLHPAVEDDARVGGAAVRVEEAYDRVAAALLLTVAGDPEADRQRTLLGERLDRLQLHPELPLVVGDATGVEPLTARLGREGLALPQLERIGRLHVVVPVDEDGGRIRRPGDLAGDESPVLADIGVAA